MTNAVKHFKFEPRGKRRIHKKPNEQEVSICSHQWLDHELHAIEPELIVALGATAARAVFGKATAIGKNRGRVIECFMHGGSSSAEVVVIHRRQIVMHQRIAVDELKRCAGHKCAGPVHIE